MINRIKNNTDFLLISSYFVHEGMFINPHSKILPLVNSSDERINKLALFYNYFILQKKKNQCRGPLQNAFSFSGAMLNSPEHKITWNRRAYGFHSSHRSKYRLLLQAERPNFQPYHVTNIIVIPSYLNALVQLLQLTLRTSSLYTTPPYLQHCAFTETFCKKHILVSKQRNRP